MEETLPPKEIQRNSLLRTTDNSPPQPPKLTKGREEEVVRGRGRNRCPMGSPPLPKWEGRRDSARHMTHSDIWGLGMHELRRCGRSKYLATLRCLMRSRETLSQAKPESDATGCFWRWHQLGRLLKSLLICPLVMWAGMVWAAMIYCWEDSACTDPNMGRHTQTPTPPVPTEPTWAQSPRETALPRASVPIACIPQLTDEKAAKLLTAALALIRKSPGWTCSFSK